MNKLLHIICVDDEKIVLDSLNSQLTRNLGNNYSYEFAESAEEALEVIEDLSSDGKDTIYVVISDWLMPGMKGDELLTKVRSQLQNVKTILLTGHVDSKVVQEIENREMGIKCIYKPWNEKDLIELIEN